MNSIVIPHTINEADVAVYYADRGGYPIEVAKDGYKDMAAIGSCKTSVEIQKSVNRGSELDLYSVSPLALSGLDQFQIQIDEAYSSWLDGGILTTSSIDSSSYLIIIIRFFDSETGVWQKLQFYYGALISDSIKGSDGVVGRSTDFTASWLEEESFNVSTNSLPDMKPSIVGKVSYNYQGVSQKAYNYDFIDETWIEQAGNDLEIDGVPLKYVLLDNVSDGFSFSVLAPNRIFSARSGKLNKPELSFSSQEVFRVRNHLSSNHYGLEMATGIELKQDFSAEPLFMNSDQPLVVFRVLNKIYATYNDGVFSIPCLVEGVPPNLRRGYFRFNHGIVDNPSSNYRGLTISDKCGYIDGTLKV